MRYEIKLVCEAHRLSQARSWIRLHPAGFVIAYPPRWVNSLYLDTLHLSNLSDNLAGLSERHKLRLRWYGAGQESVHPYLELKQKRNLLGRKKRSLLPCELDLTLSWAEILETVRAHAGAEWRAALQTGDRPTLLNRYRREYYATPDGAVRVTLDSAQSAYDQRYSLRPNLHAWLPIGDAVVLEIKAGQESAERLVEIAAQFPIPRSRNSKYVSGLLVALG